MKCLSPEEIAEKYVLAVGGHVELRTPSGTTYCECHHENPSMVEESAKKIRAVIVELIRLAQEGGEHAETAKSS